MNVHAYSKDNAREKKCDLYVNDVLKKQSRITVKINIPLLFHKNVGH